MNIAIGDWVSRVGYPRPRTSFTSNFKDIAPCTSYYVVDIDEKSEMITLRLIVDGHITEQRFWAGNFKKVVLEDIL